MRHLYLRAAPPTPGHLLVAVAALIVAACAPDREMTPVREIAITIDDTTLPDGPLFDGEKRTRMLIDALANAGVDEAMFFVTTGNVEQAGPAGDARIRAYAEAGHALANHSHSHLWLHEQDADDYIADLDRAIARLARFDNVQPYFRFPYLDEGREVAKRDRLRAALAERGLRNGYVTVGTWDWFLVSLVSEAQSQGIDVSMDALRDLYVDIFVTSAEYYDELARQALGRSPRHVLLLHENDLAALFIDDAVAALRRAGFRVIRATDAFDDPIAADEPDTLYLGQGRVAALAHVAGVADEDLRSPTENADYLRARFDAEVARLPDPGHVAHLHE